MNPALYRASYSCRVIQSIYRSHSVCQKTQNLALHKTKRFHQKSSPILWRQQRWYETSSSLQDVYCYTDKKTSGSRDFHTQIVICNHGLLSNSLLQSPCRSTFKPNRNCGTLGKPLLSLDSYSSFGGVHRYIRNGHVVVVRSLHGSCRRWKEESKVEQTVKVLKEQTPDAAKEAASVPPPAPDTELVLPAKKSLGQRFIDELKHYYHGFKLLFIDVKICIRLLWAVLNGKTLIRRERKQLVRTTADLFRLVPFLVFVIVPFMEFLLPVAVKLFPNMLPSTFAQENKEQEKIKKKLKLKLEMAKFLQDTLEETALQKKGKGSKDQRTVQEFAEFMEKIRTSGHVTTTEEIIKFSKLFEDEITLDYLRYDQLAALCRLLEINTIGTKNFLRFQLRVKLRQLEMDDRMIQKEGIDSLTIFELQEACRARGMRALGVSTERLKMQLSQWLDMHLKEKIPTSLLLLSRALYLPETLSKEDQLKATISSLPETTATEAKVKASEMAGERVDNKAKLELIRQEEEAIKEDVKEQTEAKQKEVQVKEKAEAKMAEEELAKKEALEALEQVAAAKAEQEAQDAREKLIDTAPLIQEKPEELLEDKAEAIDKKVEKKEEKKEEISPEELMELEEVLETVTKGKNIVIEEQELKEAHEEYHEDLQDLRDVVLKTGGEEITESVAAKRLKKKVNKMITQIDTIIDDLHKEKDALQEEIEVKEVKVKRSPDLKEDSEKRQEVLDEISEEKRHLISINELMLAMRRIQKVPDDTKLQRIIEVVQALDEDSDGAIDLETSMKVLELLGKENVKVEANQMKEIMALLRREAKHDEEEKQREKEEKQAAQQAEDGETKAEDKQEVQKQ